MAAVLAKGTSVIENAAREPEITDLAKCLIAMGAKIEGIGPTRSSIDGVDRLHGATYEVMPDRIEAGSYACAAGITGGSLDLVGARKETMPSILSGLADAGLIVEDTQKRHQGQRRRQAEAALALDRPLPRLSDRHAGAVHGDADPRRGHQPAHRDDLREPLHARARAEPDGRRHRGPRPLGGGARGREKLAGAPVMATDLRASMSLVLAGLAAEGETEVHRVYHLDRGYERLEEKLQAVGADDRAGCSWPPGPFRLRRVGASA
jgi:UDP-N-acetylglucosamine 1-carboxyvinyltransferase